MNGLFVAACAALLALAAAVPASALTLRIRSEGVVSSGQDTDGVFGVAGQQLDGQVYSFEAIFDLSQAGYVAYGGSRTDIYGGESYSHLPVVPPSMGGGVFTLNGHQEAVSGNSNTWLLAYNDGATSFDHQVVQERAGSGAGAVTKTMILWQEPSLGFFTLAGYAPPTGNLCDGRVCRGQFSIDKGIDGGVSAMFASLTATSTTITVVPAAVPEPSAWTLMIAGFGLAGAALRRRRDAPRAAV